MHLRAAAAPIITSGQTLGLAFEFVSNSLVCMII